MSQKKRAGSRHNDITSRKKPLRLYKDKVWYCHECGFGPHGFPNNLNCVSCGKQRSSLSRVELIPVEEESPPNISVPCFQSPEALRQASHAVPHNYYDWSHRAATPLDNDGSAISNAELSFSPLSIYLPLPIGTDANIGATAPSETPTRQSRQLSLEQWDAGIGLAPAHLHEPFFDLLPSTEAAHYDSRSNDPLKVSHFSAQKSSALSLGNVNSLQQATEPTCFAIGALQDSQYSSLEFESPLKSNYVAIDDGTDVTGSTAQGDHRYTPPTLPEGTASHLLSLEHLGVPKATSIPIPLESVTPLAYSHDHATPTHPTGTSRKSKKTARSSRKQRVITKGPSQHISSGCRSGETPQRLACPFYKYDPGTYFSCGSKSFKGVGHLKQHLKNNHKLGSLPKFPRTRLPVEKKWHWVWNKIFGESAPPPPCPYSHPLRNIQDQYHVQSPELSPDLLREEPRSETSSRIDISQIADRPPGDLDLSSLYNAVDVSSRDSLWDFGLEIFF